ncbi:MFS transporter [Paenibacillus sp. S-38]|uniref:MFS transporter n=1 Tax=Paenibacillus sp. S-38 TaxID=3416710 RepID=UPI003CEE6AC7
MKRFIWMGCLSYFLIGLAHVVIGSVLPEMLAGYGKSYGDGGLLVALQFTGFLAGVLSGPWFSARLGKRGALLLSLAALGLAELVFFAGPPWGVQLLNAPFAGFGFGMIETIIGALVIGHVEEERKTAVMARIEVFFGVGALVMPLVSALFIAREEWRGSFLTLSLLAWAVFALWLLLPMGRFSSLLGKEENNHPASRAAAGYRGSYDLLAVFLLIFALYVGAEMSVANFLPSILIEGAGVTAEQGALGVSFFWGAMALGRLVAARVADATGHGGYLILGSAGASVCLALFTFSRSFTGSLLLVALLGLFFSGMFAVALIYANRCFPGREERTTSLLIASGGVGGALLPLLTGWCMDRMPAQQSLWVLVGLCLLLVLLLALTRRQAAGADRGGGEGAAE